MSGVDAAGVAVERTQYAVQSLTRDGSIFTGGWMAQQQTAEESAARLVEINGSHCWIIQRTERVTHTEWAALAAAAPATPTPPAPSADTGGRA